MHIVQLFSTSLPPCDGIATHVMNLSERLRERGHEVTLVTRGAPHGSESTEFESFSLVRPRYFHIPPLHLCVNKGNLMQALRTLPVKPDVVHLHSPLVPAIDHDWPIVTTIHTPMLVDTAHSEGGGVRVLLNKLLGRTVSYWEEQRLLKVSDKVLTVSEGVAEELREHYEYDGECTPISNVLDLEFFKPGSDYPKEPRVLFVGRLAYRKGVFEALEAARLVVKHIPEAQFQFAGYGALESKAREFVEQHSLENNVEILGAVKGKDKIVALQKAARVVLVPSYYEGCPFSLLEAMACGKAIVSTNAKFTRGLLEDGVTGMLVEPKQPEPLAEAIVRLLEDFELCRNFGSAVRERANVLFDQDSNTDRFEEIYKQAVESYRADF